MAKLQYMCDKTELWNKHSAKQRDRRIRISMPVHIRNWRQVKSNLFL